MFKNIHQLTHNFSHDRQVNIILTTNNVNTGDGEEGESQQDEHQQDLNDSCSTNDNDSVLDFSGTFPL
jgi:hypothetical protein